VAAAEEEEEEAGDLEVRMHTISAAMAVEDDHEEDQAQTIVEAVVGAPVTAATQPVVASTPTPSLQYLSVVRDRRHERDVRQSLRRGRTQVEAGTTVLSVLDRRHDGLCTVWEG
jgi:hypothetical protein